jgi:hypothetical protein
MAMLCTEPCKTALKVLLPLLHADMAVLISMIVQSHSLPPVNHCYLRTNSQKDGLQTHTHLIAIISTVDPPMNELTGGLDDLIMLIVRYLQIVCVCVCVFV